MNNFTSVSEHDETCSVCETKIPETDFQREIADCCRQLRLSSGLAARAMTQNGMSNQAYLLNLLQSEVEYRRTKRISTLLNTAGFPRRYSFQDFQSSEVQFPTDVTAESLMSLTFFHEHKNVIMYGGTGTGKTMLSICIGIKACENEIPVRFFRTAALINMLSEARQQGNLSKFLKKLYKADLIILDEVGYVPYDRTGSQLLFDFLSDIHERKSLILNTNLEFSRWVNVFYDEQMTAALVGRLMHHCHLVLFPGGNHRLQESSIQNSFR